MFERETFLSHPPGGPELLEAESKTTNDCGDNLPHKRIHGLGLICNDHPFILPSEHTCCLPRQLESFLDWLHLFNFVAQVPETKFIVGDVAKEKAIFS